MSESDDNTTNGVNGVKGKDNQAFYLGEGQTNEKSIAKDDLKVQPGADQSSTEISISKFSILKNIFVISIAFLCLFTSFNSMANLQSSINKTLGTISLSVIYGSLVLSCAFLPSFMIKRLRAKWTLPICMLCYSTYIAAQFHPAYYTLIPGAILLGLGAAPMWSAKCAYLTQVGQVYSKIVGESSEVTITRFFGIFFFFFQLSQVVGNLISSTVLSSGVDEVVRTDEFLEQCGSNFCPWFSLEENSTTATATVTVVNKTMEMMEKEAEKYQKLVTMSSIYLTCSLLSVIIIVFLVDPLSKFGVDETKADDKSNNELLVASFSHMKKINQVLIIPLTMWSGLEQAFIQADYTRGFVSCGLGVHMVGYVMICYGACDAIFSYCFTPLVKKVGRIPIFTLGAALNITCFIVMSFWQPNPDEKSTFFILAAMWGIADAIWQTQINAFYGVIFPGEAEAAFANYRLWESLGFIIAFGFSSVICVDAKMYMLVVFLAVGMVGYYIIEVMEKRGGFYYKGKKVITFDDLLTAKQS